MGEKKTSGCGNVGCHIPDDYVGTADERGEFPKARLVLENGALRIEKIERQESQEFAANL